ncbi:MAG TPA: GNAT family N-acetyltransferase [Actinomycetes bacterium]|nr:GNAT family N-acetyltransferase [Actinomycetes bacterium]
MDSAGVAAVLPGHDVRPVQMSDVPALYDLVVRMNMADLGRVDSTEAEIRDDLTGPHFSLDADTVVAIAPDGTAVVYGQGYDEHTGVGWVDAYLDPGLPNYDEVADALIAACSERILESARGRNATSVKLTANLYEVEKRMWAAYERAGFHVETVYWRMGMKFADVPPQVPQLPDGYEIRKVTPDDDEVMAQGYELYRDTFSEHHGSSDVSLKDYSDNWRGQESYDPDAWWFAYEGDRPVGMLMGDRRRVEQGDGYVRNVGVRKELRGRGIAKALLLTSFAHWRNVGCSGVQLGVDTANVTGATRLYESVGMTSMLSAIALEREVSL